MPDDRPARAGGSLEGTPAGPCRSAPEGSGKKSPEACSHVSMTTIQNTRQNRLYGMMQFLMKSAADQAEPTVPPAREVVTEQDALTAVLGLAAAIDAPMQSGRLSQQHAEYMAEMLMVIREFIAPLPPGTADAGAPDPVTSDLQESVAEIRSASQQAGLHG